MPFRINLQHECVSVEKHREIWTAKKKSPLPKANNKLNILGVRRLVATNRFVELKTFFALVGLTVTGSSRHHERPIAIE